MFFQRRLMGEPVPIDRAFASVRVDGEISHLEGGEVLEEVAALRWSYAEIAEACFNDRACTGDLIPLNGNAEPWVIRSPAANADEQVGRFLALNEALKSSDGASHFLTAAALEAL